MTTEPAHWGPTELGNLPPEEWERFRLVRQPPARGFETLRFYGPTGPVEIVPVPMCLENWFYVTSDVRGSDSTVMQVPIRGAMSVESIVDALGRAHGAGFRATGIQMSPRNWATLAALAAEWTGYRTPPRNLIESDLDHGQQGIGLLEDQKDGL